MVSISTVVEILVATLKQVETGETNFNVFYLT